MKIEILDINSVFPDSGNARLHNEKNISSIKGSLSRFGQQKPIVIDENNVVRAGNGTLQAAKELGWKTIQVVKSDLKSIEMTAYALSDNRTTDTSNWDDPVLAELMKNLKDENFPVEDIGFDDEFLSGLETPEVEGRIGDDEVPEVDDKEVWVKEGDLFQLGDHRLLCGDCTVKENVDKLMDGQKADMVFTDPPYGGNVGGLKSYTGKELEERKKANKNLVYQDKKIRNDESIDFLSEAFLLIRRFWKSDGTAMCFFRWREWGKIKQFTEPFGEWSSVCVWDRVKRANSFFRFQPTHEFCLHIGNLSDKKESANLSNVWHVEKDEREIHPTVKPINILEPAIRVCCEKEKIVLDPFLGSGSTLIACEKTNRKCYGMEIDPYYCQIIIERWEQYTGKKAEKIND